MNSTAWIVNWVCVAIIFMGLVMLGKQSADTTQLRNEQIRDLMEMNIQLKANIARQDQDIARMLEALVVIPKDVLPHVLNIEKRLTHGCTTELAKQ